MERAGILDERDGPRDVRAAAGPLWRGFAALVVVTHALIVLGALVRVHGAGLACPDWPLCFGELIPRFDFQIAFEWSHRVLAGSVALGFAGLATLAWRRLAAGDPVRRALALAAAGLLVQILLGALTVWQLLDFRTVTAHLLVGNGVAAVFLWIALALRERTRPPSPAVSASVGVRGLLALCAGLLFWQMALGGMVSSQYAGPVCPEWPTCAGGQWFPSLGGLVGLHLLHRMNGYLLLATLGALAWAARETPRLGPLAAGLAGLGLLQVAVGVANVLTGIPVEVTGLHSFLATALVLTTTAAARVCWGRATV